VRKIYVYAVSAGEFGEGGCPDVVCKDLTTAKKYVWFKWQVRPEAGHDPRHLQPIHWSATLANGVDMVHIDKIPYIMSFAEWRKMMGYA